MARHVAKKAVYPHFKYTSLSDVYQKTVSVQVGFVPLIGH